MSFKDRKLEIVKSLLIKLMAVLFDRVCAKHEFVLCSCVCATVERHTKILCQSYNFCLKGVVCSTHCCCLISKTLDCVTLCLSIVVMMVFQSRAAVCVTLCFWERTQVGNRLGLWFIEISFASHCAAAFLRAPACSNPSRLLFCVSCNNDAWFAEWKTQMSSPLRTNLLFPRKELLCRWFKFFLG